MTRRRKIFFDGGWRPEAGQMEIAVVASGQATIRRGLGLGTSMEAEWLALIEALTTAQSLDMDDFVLLGDAADVIAKANGTIRCGVASQPYLARFIALAGASRPRVRYIKRSHNLAGIALARLHPR